MPKIAFDVLVPEELSETVFHSFDSAAKKLVAAEKLTRAEVHWNRNPKVWEGVENQLRETYRDDHDGQDLENASVHRFVVDCDGVQGSVNQLAMAFSRLLTPPANLPNNPVALHHEEAFELPAIFPWSLNVSA